MKSTSSGFSHRSAASGVAHKLRLRLGERIVRGSKAKGLRKIARNSTRGMPAVNHVLKRRIGGIVVASRTTRGVYLTLKARHREFAFKIVDGVRSLVLKAHNHDTARH